jgi:hypothetical protein
MTNGTTPLHASWLTECLHTKNQVFICEGYEIIVESSDILSQWNPRILVTSISLGSKVFQRKLRRQVRLVMKG